MANPFDKDFDTILEEILTDYSNLDSQPDTSTGSTAWIIASVLASVVWGLYRYQDYISRQHFPDTADTDNLNHWGSIYNVDRDEDDTDADYLAKILSFIRQPPAGGNALDYENWALDRDEVSYIDGDSTFYNNYVTVQDVDNGVLGAVGIYTIPTDETTITAGQRSGLVANTQTYISSVRPLGILSATVYDTTESIQTIDLDVYPEQDSTVNTTLINEAIVSELSEFKPGETLFKSTITCIALNFGANNAVVNTPAAEETTITNFGYFRTDTTSVTVNYNP